MVLILMGVTGAGKSTVGNLLARKIGWRFYDADDLHPAANKEKMSHRIPLTDEDRLPWLNAVRALIEKCLSEGTDAVIACSALRQAYRDLLQVDPAKVKFVYLKASKALIEHRLAQRTGHFMNKDLLQSQFETLEEPTDAIAVDVSGDPDSVVNLIRAKTNVPS
jgi:gluconokinase